MESEVLRRFYSDIQHAITNPIGVASLLHQEGVVGEVLLDEVSPTSKVSSVEKTASIMRHVEAAIRVDPKSFWVFLSVLDQFTPSRFLAERMRQAVDLHTSAAQNVSSPAATSHDALEENVTVSEVYKKDFDAISGKFVSLHFRASHIMSENNIVTVLELKELLTSYPELELSLQCVETISQSMHVVQQHSSFINCFYLEHIAEEFKLPEVKKEIDDYYKLVDEFCNSKIIQHSYMKRFATNPPQYNMSSQTIKIKIMLEWNPASKTLSDIRSLLRKAFKGLSPLIHVDVIGEGSVTVVCYAPHYLMGALVKMTKKNKSMLLENSVSYLSIGYTVVLDSTAAEKEAHVSDLKQENTSLQLKCTALQDQCKELQSQLSQLVEKKSDIELKQQLKEMLPDEPTTPTQRLTLLSELGQSELKKSQVQLETQSQITSIEKSTETNDLFVSEVYQEDFDAINRKFKSLHNRISDMLEKNRSVPLKKLKQLLSTHADLKGPLESAHSFNSVMCIVLEYSSIINCFTLRHVAEHFNLPEVTQELDKYKEQVDEFCQKTIREHSYVKQFVGEHQKHFLSTRTITLKLEWNPDKKTLADIQSLIRKTFHGLSDLIHVDVISEGSVKVVSVKDMSLMSLRT